MRRTLTADFLWTKQLDRSDGNMCVIVDNSVSHHVFTDNPSEAAQRLLNWIDSGQSRFVAGGKLLHELKGNSTFKIWMNEALKRGTARRIGPARVTARVKVLQQNNQLRSNDTHVIALAQLTGARLLFSDDKALNRDFENPNLIHSPNGSVYTTLGDSTKSFTPKHAELLRRDDLCSASCISAT